jgi:signal transduction histidine kinase
MAAGIAHEIRNPLMSIKLLVQATSERGAAGFRPRDLQILEEEIIRLEQIVSGFLDFARPPKMNFQQVELGDLIGRTLSGVEARAALQGVHLVWQPPAPGTATLEADPSQLKQVLFNLLFNALDAQPGGGRIELRLLEEPQPYVHSELASHPGWMLEVQDAGPGIPTELGESIFEPFISSKETGLGLGLSICRRILEAHGGVIDYESSSEGTTFRLWLPMTQSPPQDADPAGRRSQATVAVGLHTDRDPGLN